MKKDNEKAKKENEPAGKPNRKVVVISLFILVTVGLGWQYYDSGNESNIDIAAEKVSNLFELVDEEGESSEVKGSIDQTHINEALGAINRIDTSGGDQKENEENSAIVFALHSAVFHAQYQLNKREGTLESSDNSTQEEQKVEEFHPNEDDVVLHHNDLKNKDLLEAFMEDAGENGVNNESEIRVIKDEGANGVMIYDLKSRYDKNANQAWIDVFPDLSNYRASENEVQDVFNNGHQQCGYMSKDETEGYYKLNECRTHWEYRLLPITSDNRG